MVFASRISNAIASAGVAFCALVGTASAAPNHMQYCAQLGIASSYGKQEAGRRTASGVVFDPAHMSAAHRTLPSGSCVRVTRLANHRTILVPIIDRGPYVRGRLLDLSQAAAERLGMIAQGLARVRIELTPCVDPYLIGARL
jgi:rare lipoprotein A